MRVKKNVPIMWIVSMIVVCALVAACIGLPIQAGADEAFSLPNYYTENVVFQRGKPFVVSGKASVGSSVEVTIGDHSASGTVNDEGKFEVSVDPLDASLDPYSMSVSVNGSVVKRIEKVYSGEVIVATGQSNMEASEALYYSGTQANVNFAGLLDEKNLPELVNDEHIYFIKADQVGDEDEESFDVPLRYSDQSWLNGKDDADKLSYVAQYAAEAIRAKEPDVPVGVLDLAWGGTTLKNHMTSVWNTHYAPFAGFNVMGILWYQGESNTSLNVPPLMNKQFYMLDWTNFLSKIRKNFGDENLPFIQAQLTRYDGPNWIYYSIRSIQNDYALKKNVGMVSTLDTDKGVPVLHPLGKEIVGKRMGNQLFAFSKKKTVPSGPIAKKAVVTGETVSVSFKYGKGLKSCTPLYKLKVRANHICQNDTSGEISEVEVSGSDGVFHTVQAKVSGGKLVASLQGIEGDPQQIRYAADNVPQNPNLYNGNNLPAGTFVLDISNGVQESEYRTVAFNPMGGPHPITPIQGKVGSQITLPAAATRYGYIFQGWSSSSDGSGELLQPGDVMDIPDKNITTMYAIWQQETSGNSSKSMTISFDANGGDGNLKDQTITLGESIKFPSDVHRDGSELTGWNIVVYGHSYSVKPGKKWTSPTWKLLAGQSVVAYAQWK